jgi:hypothetical protein
MKGITILILKQVLKITLLIVILAEEIKSVIKPNYLIMMNIDKKILKDKVDNFITTYNSNLN